MSPAILSLPPSTTDVGDTPSSLLCELLQLIACRTILNVWSSSGRVNAARRRIEMPTGSIQQLFDLAGKAALVTGGARGIGRAVVERLVEAGTSVMIADLDGESARHAAEQLRAQGYAVAAMQADIGNAEQARAAVQQ